MVSACYLEGLAAWLVLLSKTDCTALLLQLLKSDSRPLWVCACVCVQACPTEPVAYVCENMLLLFMCSSPLGNHLGQSNKSQSDSSRQSNIMSSPSAGSKATQNSLPPMDASPSRPSVFPSSVYTTPTKQETSASKVRLGGACFVFFPAQWTASRRLVIF